MRLLNLYIVLDTQAKCIVGNIQHGTSAVPTVRAVAEAVNGEKGVMKDYPEQFEILHVGMIDDETGRLYDIKGEIAVSNQGSDSGYWPIEPEVVAQAVALRTRSV